MAISLEKGQRVTLDNNLKWALVGLGWDVNRFGDETFDLDASVFMLGENGKVACDEDFVFYNQLHGRNDAVVSRGDNLTGEGEGDDEVIIINFDKIPADIQKIVVVVTIHDSDKKHQNFGQVSNAFVRVAKLADEFDEIGEQVLRFDLEEEFSVETGVVFCEIYRKDGEWKFNAVAGGFEGGLKAACDMYGVAV